MQFANKIKLMLVDFLLSGGIPEVAVDDFFIANEVSFLSGNRRADLTLVTESKTIAFEIKSEKDTLKRVQGQLEDYKKAFNEVYVVTESSHLYQLRQSIDKNVGIILVNLGLGSIAVLRKAKTTKKLCKRALAEFLSLKGLNLLYPNSEVEGVPQKRDLAVKSATYSQMYEALFWDMKNRYLSAYNSFLKERGKVTVVEDLKTLTIRYC